ncbi:MAG: tetratricopeptide repeat protein [Alphaproteobacteria bacterium]|nr:tetratricopeptide repeat protein [Alphaproteobacteria bacterium]
MSDLNSDLVTQEVDEEVRRERMMRLWQATRKYVIGGAVGVVLVVAGREVYNNRVASLEEAQSEVFQAAIQAASEEGADATTAWQDAIANLDAGGYQALARMRAAGAQVEEGKLAEAMASYDAVAADTSADSLIRELATLKSAMLQASVSGELDSAKGKLTTIAIMGKAWYFSAQEQLALIDLQQGEIDAALQKFILLADDAETPQTIQERATQFRNFIEAQQFSAGATAVSAETEEANDAAEGDTP